MHSSSQSTLQTADRALQILLQFEQTGDVRTVTDLARALELNRSTASRLVTTLVARGFLARGPGDAVHLGPELVRLGAVAGDGLLTLAGPVLAALADETGEAATLAVACPSGVLTVAEAAGHYYVALRSWIGVRTPAHCTADGRVLIAFGALPVPGAPLDARTPHTITDPARLQTELDLTRTRGWAVSRGELESGLHGVAAPVLVAGACVAAVCVSGPEYRIDAHALDGLAATVRAAADRLAAMVSSGPEPATARAA